MSYRWQSAVRTETGNVRELNEDACLDLSARGVWAVADGMGGHAAGDVASRLIVELLAQVRSHDRFSGLVDDVEDRVLDANARLHAMSRQGYPPRIIGSTIAVLLAFGGHCLSAWAGDSRVYRSRGGRLHQITRDHSEIEDLIASGQLEREQAESHPSSNVITRAVGGAPRFFLDLAVERLQDGDRYLICSDGLYRELALEEMAQRLEAGTCTEACERLLDTALERECADNVTAVVVDFTATPS